MHRATRLKTSTLSPHLVCVLCGGYLIDATTIVECLHSFCKTCIVRYLESSKFCPICDVQVHKTKPLLNIRLDHTLQDIVYKLVPGLFKDEMTRRRKFYDEHIGKDNDKRHYGIMTVGPDSYFDEDSDIRKERVIFSEDEQISLALKLSIDGRPPRKGVENGNVYDCRFLLCPAGFTIGHLKKFVKLKFSLCDRFQIDMYHTDDVLNDDYTLMDIAYIYSWRRKKPMVLFYTVFSNPAKRFKRSPSCTVTKDNSETEKEQEVKNTSEEKEKVPLPEIPTDKVTVSDNEKVNIKVAVENRKVVKTDTENGTQSPKVENVNIQLKSTPTSSSPSVHNDKISKPTSSPKPEIPKTVTYPKLPPIKIQTLKDRDLARRERALSLSNGDTNGRSSKSPSKSPVAKSPVAKSPVEGSERSPYLALNTQSPRINGVNFLAPSYPLVNGTHAQHLHHLHHTQPHGLHDNEEAEDLSMKKRPLQKHSYDPIVPNQPAKQNGVLLPNGEVDKFAFTDDDEIPLKNHKLHHIKAEPIQ